MSYLQGLIQLLYERVSQTGREEPGHNVFHNNKMNPG